MANGEWILNDDGEWYIGESGGDGDWDICEDCCSVDPWPNSCRDISGNLTVVVSGVSLCGSCHDFSGLRDLKHDSVSVNGTYSVPFWSVSGQFCEYRLLNIGSCSFSMYNEDSGNCGAGVQCSDGVFDYQVIVGINGNPAKTVDMRVDPKDNVSGTAPCNGVGYKAFDWLGSVDRGVEVSNQLTCGSSNTSGSGGTMKAT